MPAADLARFAQAALAARQHAARRGVPPRAAAPWRRRDSESNADGPGLDRARRSTAASCFNHDGGTAGFASSLWLDPRAAARDSAVLSNAQVEVERPGAAPARRERAAQGPRPDAPGGGAARAQTSSTTLAGVYAVRPAFRLTISVRDDQLWAQATARVRSSSSPGRARRFFARVTPLEIEFAEGSPPPSLTVHQGGMTLRFVARMTPPGRARPAPARCRRSLAARHVLGHPVVAEDPVAPSRPRCSRPRAGRSAGRRRSASGPAGSSGSW